MPDPKNKMPLDGLGAGVDHCHIKESKKLLDGQELVTRQRLK